MLEHLTKLSERIESANDELKEATMEAADWLATCFWNDPEMGEVAREAYRQACESIGSTSCNTHEMLCEFANVEGAFEELFNPSPTDERAEMQGVTASVA